MQDSFYKKIEASFATGFRGDFSIDDFQKLDDHAVHILLAYNEKIGMPTGNDIETYFGRVFEGKVTPLMASCSIKPKTVSIVAQLSVPTRPYDDALNKDKMTPVIAQLMYLDNKLKDYWEVRTDGDKKVLAKSVSDDIEQIVAARRNRMFITQTPSVSLASVHSYTTTLDKGDVVLAYNNGDAGSFEITARVQGGYRGKFEGQEKEILLASEKVLDLQQIGADKIPDETSKLVKYFEEAYGDKKYAKLLAK